MGYGVPQKCNHRALGRTGGASIRRGVLSKENFPLFYWEGMERVLKLFPEMFRVWATKHVSHFQGTT
jgi:hypothetical protein